METQPPETVADQHEHSPSDNIEMQDLRISNEIQNKTETNTYKDNDGKITMHLSISHQILFIIFSLGPSWMLLDAMFIQVPYFQQHQPESFKIAARMSLSGAISMATIIPIYYLIINTYKPSYNSYRYLMYALIIFQIITTLIISLSWSISIGNVSITIMFVTYCSAAVGHLQAVAIIPWLTFFNPKLSALVLLGSNVASIFTAFLGLLQKPGENIPLFQPGIFYLIIICITFLSLIAWIYLDRNLIKPFQTKLAQQKMNSNMIRNVSENNRKKSSKNFCLLLYDGIVQTVRVPIWWRKVYKYAVLDSYIQVITWTFIRSTLPYAISHSVRSGGGESTEQYAIELSYVAVMLGSLTAVFVPIKAWKAFVAFVVIFSVFGLVFIVFVIDNVRHLLFDGESVLIVIIVFCMRYIDGYLSPLIFKCVAELFPNESMEMNKWIAGIEKLLAFSGIWIIYAFVESGAIY